MKRSKLQRKRIFWILLGALTYFIMRLAARHTFVAEEVYGAFLYPAVRGVFRYTFGLLPFPALYLVAVALIYLAYRTAIVPLVKKTWNWKSLLFGIVSTISAVFSMFYILWGFNYSRPGVVERLELFAIPLDTLALQEEFEYATEELLSWTIKHEDLIKSRLAAFPKKDETILAEKLKGVVAPLGYKDIPRPRGRRLFPKGILMRFSTAGIYIPFSGEGHVDAGMLPVQYPFTMAHELAHGYGVTNEGECNFLAYLTCKAVDDPVIRFSGLLSYWRYVASEYRRRFPEDYKVRFEKLPPLITETLMSIRENGQKYPDIMPALRDRVYDSYLKSNGIEDGLVSYSMIVRMVHAYRLRQGSAFQ